MNTTYWVVTETTETSFTKDTARESLDAAMKHVESMTAVGVRCTVLRNGNIVWVG